MFDPHIYACQSLTGVSNSNPSIQAIANDATQNQNQTPTSSPQKNKHVNSNTVIPIQSTGGSTPQRKQSHPDDGQLRDITVVGEMSGHSEIATTTHLMQNAGSINSSGSNSRKTSTISNPNSSDTTPENTVLTPKLGSDLPETQILSATPKSSLDSNQPKPSPVRKLSRFLVSPTVVETANHELIVQEGSHAPASSPQIEPQQSMEMNINEENYQRTDVPGAELLPQQSIGLRMPETLEQLKIELENITHASVSAKNKELLSHQSNLQGQNLENDDSHDLASEGLGESGADYTSMEAVGLTNTGDNTSVYNSRRTSADMNTNPTDLTSTASGLEYEENLVSEPALQAIDENAPKMTQTLAQQMSIEK
jgi:hypothetical protein